MNPFSSVLHLKKRRQSIDIPINHISMYTLLTIFVLSLMCECTNEESIPRLRQVHKLRFLTPNTCYHCHGINVHTEFHITYLNYIVPYNCRLCTQVLIVMDFVFSTVFLWLYLVLHWAWSFPWSLCIVVAVAISLDQINYKSFENEEVVTVTLSLNNTYHEDILVNVAVGELLGGCIRELSCANSGGKWSCHRGHC